MPGTGTRPTSDRVRESLFAALESLNAIAGARVLDLYAGSGALGLESLSRGAANVDLVERGYRAAAIIRRNAAVVAKAGGFQAAQVHESAVQTYLRRAKGPFDVVFTDPPYDLDDDVLAADLVAITPLLSTHAVVIVERARRCAPPGFAMAGLELFREKSYGDTTLWWAEPVSGDEKGTSEAQPETESQSR